MAMSDRELFARLIRCEAEGEGMDGMRGVATVVMNRVHAASGEYMRVNQGSLRRVIEQQGQFSCMTDPARNIWITPPEAIHYEVADWALSGNKLNMVGECLWFMNPFTSTCPGIFPRNGSGSIHTRVAQHCFYRPTARYYET